MKVYLLLIVVIVFSACTKTTKLETTYENGDIKEEYFVLKSDEEIKNGPYKRYYENSQLAEVANYVDNKLEGTRKFYSFSGQLEIEQTHYQDDFHGPYTTYFESGNKSSSGEYDKNFMVGVWKYYYDLPNTPIKEEIIYENNMENGPFKEYYEEGQLKTEGFYKDEVEDGLLKEYDKDGNIIKEIFYENGRMKHYKEFDVSGQLIKEEDYTDVWDNIKEE